MKLRFLFSLAVASIIALSSCEKDDPATTASGNPPAAKRLKKVTSTEAGVTTVYNLTYDNNKLVSYKTADNSKYVNFSYDAQGNLSGIEDQEEDFKNIYAYTYLNNIPTSGTLKSWQLVSGQPAQLIEDDSLTYTVVNNQVTAIRLDMLQTGDVANLQLTYTNANLTKVVSDGPTGYTADFSFGTHRSAFPKVSKFVLDQAGFSLQFACNNDMLSASYDFPGTNFDRSINNQYTYDSDGYVLTSNDGTEQMVFEYE